MVAFAFLVFLAGLLSFLSPCVLPLVPGYVSMLSGVGVGWLVEHHGWDAGFLMFIAAAVVGMLLFVLCWPARADGYDRP